MPRYNLTGNVSVWIVVEDDKVTEVELRRESLVIDPVVGMSFVQENKDDFGRDLALTEIVDVAASLGTDAVENDWNVPGSSWALRKIEDDEGAVYFDASA